MDGSALERITLWRRSCEDSFFVLVVPSKQTFAAPQRIDSLGEQCLPYTDHARWVMFATPGKHTKPHEKVTVVIGDFRAENLVVQ